MKTIKTKRSWNYEAIFEVCASAAKQFYVYTSDYNDTVEIEQADEDMKSSEVMDEIRSELHDNNPYKDADDKKLKKLIKDNYILVNMCSKCDNLESANDHSWDNAVFNGGD